MKARASQIRFLLSAPGSWKAGRAVYCAWLEPRYRGIPSVAGSTPAPSSTDAFPFFGEVPERSIGARWKRDGRSDAAPGFEPPLLLHMDGCPSGLRAPLRTRMVGLAGTRVQISPHPPFNNLFLPALAQLERVPAYEAADERSNRSCGATTHLECEQHWRLHRTVNPASMTYGVRSPGTPPSSHAGLVERSGRGLPSRSGGFDSRGPL